VSETCVGSASTARFPHLLAAILDLKFETRNPRQDEQPAEFGPPTPVTIAAVPNLVYLNGSVVRCGSTSRLTRSVRNCPL
jgi:hypothetical protein